MYWRYFTIISLIKPIILKNTHGSMEMFSDVCTKPKTEISKQMASGMRNEIITETTEDAIAEITMVTATELTTGISKQMFTED